MLHAEVTEVSLDNRSSRIVKLLIRGMNNLQVSWVGSLTRQNSLSSSAYQPTQSQQASQQQQHLPPHQQLTPQNSLSSYHSSVYNGGRGTRSSSIQYEDSTKPINNLTARGTVFTINQ